MPRFFVESVENDFIEINGDDARHISLSLRMKKGESLVLCDGKGREAEAVIREAFPENVVLDITERRDSIAEPKTEVVLYQALPKFDKLEYIIQKSVELGVSKIVPVLSSRCISRPDEKTMKKKLEQARFDCIQVKDNRLVLAVGKDYFTKNGIPEIYYDFFIESVKETNDGFDKWEKDGMKLNVDSLFQSAKKEYLEMRKQAEKK